MHALAALSLLVVLSPPTAPPRQGAWMLEVGLTAAQVTERTKALQAAGFRPACVNAYNDGEANRFAVIYRKADTSAWKMDWGLTPEQFQKRAGSLPGEGYTLVCLSGCNLVGAERLTDLWLKQTSAARSFNYGLDADGLLRQAKVMRARGWRPVWLSSYMANTRTLYAAIWEKSDLAWELKYGLTPNGLQQSLDDLATRGFRPLSISGHSVEGEVRYCAVWEKRNGPAWQARYGQTQDDLLAFARVMASQGYRPTAVTGHNTLKGDRFASIWEKETPTQ